MSMKTIRTESGLLVYLPVFVIIFLLSGKAGATEVQEQYQGLTVNANLELAEGKTLQDGVILLTHALLMHNRMEIIKALQALFKEHGYSSLAINYSLNISDRHGPIDCNEPHHHSRQQSLDEIGFWLAWLKKNGVKRIILAGHSAGANDIVEYHSHNPDPAISHLFMITPATSDHSVNTPAGYRSRYQKDVNITLAEAQKLVDAGRGEEIMPKTDFLYCPAAPVSAATFVSYYAGYNSVRLLPTQLQRIKIPTIFIAAGADNMSTDMMAIVKPYVDGKRIQLVTIDGASHFLRDLYLEDAVDAMVSFLQTD
jgi:pimeloyl-ACP methyl ester carboxylesterase